MDNIPATEQEEKKRKRRKKGSRTHLSRVKKQHYLKDKEADSSSTTESASIHASSDSASQSENMAPTTSCTLPFTEAHVCQESDSFSETDSESDESSNTQESGSVETGSEMQQAGSSNVQLAKKRRRKSRLTVKKGASASKKKPKGTEADLSTTSMDTTVSSIQEELGAHSIDLPEVLVSNEETKDTGNASSISETTKDPQDSALILINNLKLLLPPTWVADVVENGISRLIKLNNSEKAAVQISIFFDCQKWRWGIYVHGIPVQFESTFGNMPLPLPEKDNLGSAADFLLRVVTFISDSEICAGIAEYEELWMKAKGFIDKICTPCFRSSDCLLIVKKNISVCKNCLREKSKFERATKSKGKEGTQMSRTRDEHLLWEEMKEKKDTFKTKYKLEKNRGDRLQKKVDRLQIKLDAALKDELSSVLINNQHKMTEMQKIFWESQRAAFASNDRRGLRWHPMMIRLALSLHCRASGGYDYLAQTGVLILPSTRRLYDYSHFIEAKEGCYQEIISDIRKKIDRSGPEEHFSYINLMFDEMHIRSGLVTSKSTGEVVGFTNLNEAEKELELLQKEIEEKSYKPKLAKKVLVYLAQGITSTVKEVVAIFSTDDLSSIQLYTRTWDVIYYLEDAGIKVLSITCDGAATNRKFIRMHESLEKSSKEIFCTKNLKSGVSRPLYFIIDPPHLLKTVRNCLANSFSHRKTRKLWKNNEFLSWQVLEKLYEITKHDKYREHKLTKAHIKLSSFSCMTVLLATQSLSLSVANSIQTHADHESIALLDTSELIKFIKLMNRFFDCLNGKEDPQEATAETSENVDNLGVGGMLRNPDLAAYRSLDDSRFQFLEEIFLNFFEDWKQDILNRPGFFTDAEKSRMIISHQSLESLTITVKSFIGATKFMLRETGAPKVNARVFNQDPLEQYFGKIRRRQGDNRQPLLHSVLHTAISEFAQGSASLPSSKGNTSVNRKKGLTVDHTPAPSRKKSKKP